MKSIKYFIVVLILGAGFVQVTGQPVATTTITPGNITMPNAPAANVLPTDVYIRENIIPEKKPVPYSYLREADVMWAKDVWRVIDLRQRMNFPLRYPDIDPIYNENRFSLYLLLMDALEREEIVAYEFGDRWKNPFQVRMSLDQIYEKIRGEIFYNADSSAIEFKDIKGNYVNQIYIKEKWYFDKKHSEMRVRITAIVPSFDLPKIVGAGIDKVFPFAVYFPECRRTFATHPVFNANNDAQRISFDDLFMQRRFASTIAGESSIHDNRMIVDFMSGQDALMEAERIKTDIFIMEHDLWEY